MIAKCRPCRFEEVTLTILLVSHFMSLIYYCSYIYACAKFDLNCLCGCFAMSFCFQLQHEFSDSKNSVLEFSDSKNSVFEFSDSKNSVCCVCMFSLLRSL